MALGKYVKAAFVNHWNLLLFAGGAVFSFLSGAPDVVLPLVVAAEVAYLGLLGTHPKFQRYVEAQDAKDKRDAGQRTTEASFNRITSGLPEEYLQRYEALRKRCLELRQIALDLHQRAPGVSRTPLEQMQLAGLDRLLWIYLRLLHTSWSLERFFKSTSESEISADITRLEAKLAEFEKKALNPRREKAKVALTDNLNTSKARLDNLTKAHENHELIQLEIDRLENKIRTLSEISVNRQEPDFISDQVDAVAGSMLETEKTMNDLQFATGMTASETAVPELLTRELESEEEQPEEELEPPPLPESRRARRRRRRQKDMEEFLMLDEISLELSKRILAVLLSDGLTLTEIAKEAGTTVAFLKRVAAGDAALKPKHLEKLDDAHPGLPFRIGRDLMKENVADLGKKSRKVAKKIQSKGEAAVDSVGHKLRQGAWRLVNLALDDSD